QYGQHLRPEAAHGVPEHRARAGDRVPDGGAGAGLPGAIEAGPGRAAGARVHPRPDPAPRARLHLPRRPAADAGPGARPGAAGPGRRGRGCPVMNPRVLTNIRALATCPETGGPDDLGLIPDAALAWDYGNVVW